MELEVGMRYKDRDRFILEIREIHKHNVIYYASRIKNGIVQEERGPFSHDKDSFAKTFPPMFIKVKHTRLARKMYPDAQEKDEMLVIEC